MARNYAQGKFQMQNPAKYIGKGQPTYRSGWEMVFMQFCDNNPAILQWASESINIPYRNPFTNKSTIYVPDFLIIYEDKSGKKHAEVIEISYDPKEISLEELLLVFFKTHDPTTLNRQGNDVGTQYRSVIFYADEQQRSIAMQLIKQLEDAKVFDATIVTELSPASEFYPAEEYHQDYFNQNSYQPYCSFVIQPKLNKFMKEFEELLTK
jgi:methionine-S-sulfoxide reductase